MQCHIWLAPKVVRPCGGAWIGEACSEREGGGVKAQGPKVSDIQLSVLRFWGDKAWVYGKVQVGSGMQVWVYWVEKLQ